MKEKLLVGFMWLGLASIVAWSLTSCSAQKPIFHSQKAVLEKRSFRVIGKPSAYPVQIGDTINLLTSTRKLRIKK